MTTSVIDKFYQAFQRRDFSAMQECYHDEATFSDPVFPALEAKQVKAMWQMLIIAGKDLQLTYRKLTEETDQGTVKWIATYTFSMTGRKVVNEIVATIRLKDGLIFRHQDRFRFYKWARMAFGGKGSILGYMPFFRKKVQKISAGKLEEFMKKNPGN